MASRPLASPDEVEDTDEATRGTSSSDAAAGDSATSFRSRLLGRRDPYDEAYEAMSLEAPMASPAPPAPPAEAPARRPAPAEPGADAPGFSSWLQRSAPN